jgi:hypothetical protein
VAIFPALQASVVSHLALGWPTPFLEASGVPVADMIAFGAPHHISLLAFLGLMPDLVALETHLL